MSDDVIKLIFWRIFRAALSVRVARGRLLLSVIIIDQKMKTTCVWEDGDGGTK
jgi:hypothetical protein